MRVHHLSAVVALALSCAFTASCLQTEDTASPSIAIERVNQRADGTEPIGEAPLPMSRLPLGSKDFPFVVKIKDDGKEDGGGWQITNFVLGFGEMRGLTVTYQWQCPIEVGMPIRSSHVGRITPSRAALITAEITNEAAPEQQASRDDWEGQGAAFCIELRERMNKMFRDWYKGYGATATQWLR